ncbi:hypothetical protein NZK33_00145 [Cyanobium sp. FGCU-6]|jgi:hypothetical protein|nr:hypothetical protein [Cyanobium sp. FGCU6]
MGTLARLAQVLSRLSMPLLLLAGHAAAGLFLVNLDHGLAQIEEPALRRFSQGVYGLFSLLVVNNPLVRPLVGVALAVVLWRSLRARPLAWAIDGLGVLLCLRCALQFVLLNLLLLAPLRSGGLLLIQLVLFLPVITVAFGWLYWRLDTGARRLGRNHLRFEEPSEEVGVFDYLLLSVRSLLQLEPAGAIATTRLMKSLFVLHGVVMLNLIALTLSRAIGLATGGTA